MHGASWAGGAPGRLGSLSTQIPRPRSLQTRAQGGHMWGPTRREGPTVQGLSSGGWGSACHPSPLGTNGSGIRSQSSHWPHLTSQLHPTASPGAAPGEGQARVQLIPRAWECGRECPACHFQMCTWGGWGYTPRRARGDTCSDQSRPVLSLQHEHVPHKVGLALPQLTSRGGCMPAGPRAPAHEVTVQRWAFAGRRHSQSERGSASPHPSDEFQCPHTAREPSPAHLGAKSPTSLRHHQWDSVTVSELPPRVGGGLSLGSSCSRGSWGSQ